MGEENEVGCWIGFRLGYFLGWGLGIFDGMDMGCNDGCEAGWLVDPVVVVLVLGL